MSIEIEDADEVLAERSRRGHAGAFVKLATRWWAPVYRVAWNMSGSTFFAAEVAERALLAALRPSRRWSRSGAPFRTSLYRLAMGFAVRRGQKVTSRPSTVPLASIWQALDQLDQLDRASLVLREIEQLSLEEAAEILGASPAEIKARAHRALLYLTCLLGQTFAMSMSA
jgi:RNA polymerase sigma-70 factor, ECF subfamily